MRFLNHFWLSPWLPEPRLYTWQVESELRYQTRRFTDESFKSLDRIDEASPLRKLLIPFNTRLDPAIVIIEKHRQRVKDFLQTNKPTWFTRSLIPEQERINTRNHFTSLDRPYTGILAIRETLQLHENNWRRLRSRLESFRESFNRPNIQFSPTGIIAVPAALKNLIESSPFEWLEEAEGKGNKSRRSEIKAHAHVYYYDLDRHDWSRPIQLRKEIADLCRNPKNMEITSGTLYMICAIWAHATTISELDKDALGSVQRSWVVERREAARRYERKASLDDESLIKLMKSTYMDYIHGTPVPEHL